MVYLSAYPHRLKPAQTEQNRNQQNKTDANLTGVGVLDLKGKGVTLQNRLFLISGLKN